MVDNGQASPSDVPSMVVRAAGQIGPSPSIKTDHSVGSRTIGTEEACVVGCEMR
jgi:hypothetical protein